MLEVILLIVGIVKLVRRPKLKRMTSADYPNVTPDKFREWKAAELKATDIFLWATWGAFFIKIIVLLAIQDSYTGETGLAIMGIILVLWFIGLIIAASFGRKAKKLREALGIGKSIEKDPVIHALKCRKCNRVFEDINLKKCPNCGFGVFQKVIRDED